MCVANLTQWTTASAVDTPSCGTTSYGQLALKECSDVQVEPSLHPLSGKHLSLRSSKRDDGARLDVAATNFWSHDRQHTSFDVRVFNPLAPSNSQPLPTCYRKHEKEKAVGMIKGSERLNMGGLPHWFLTHWGHWSHCICCIQNNFINDRRSNRTALPLHHSPD